MKKLLFVLILLSYNTFSQVSLIPSTTEFKLGEPIAIDLSLSFQEGDKIVWPRIVDTLSSNWVVIDTMAIDTLKQANSWVVSQRFTITRFDTTLALLKPLLFRVNGDSLFSEPLLFNLIKPTLNGDDFYDIKPIEEAPTNWEKILTWLGLGLLGGLGLLYLIIYLLKNRKKETVEEISTLPPWEIAYRKLEKLEIELGRELNQKLFYVQLTFVLREYLEEAFELPALESTSSELLNQLSSLNVSPEQYAKIEKLLKDSDLIKFAKLTIADELHSENVFIVREFVDKYRPVTKEENHVS